jgi:ABC-type branched-subunit amino acid transport system ATPase component
MGAYGAGKSTTLGAIAGLVRPRRRRILFDGKEITAEGPRSGWHAARGLAYPMLA